MNVLGSAEAWWRSPLDDRSRWSRTTDRTAELTVDGRLVTVPDALNHVGVLAMGDPGEAAEVLRGERPYAPGRSADRVVLRGCGGCGDDECGVLSARLARTEEQVTWSDWQWECYYDEPEAESLPTFTFEPAQYDDAVAEAVARASEPGSLTMRVVSPVVRRRSVGPGGRRRRRVAALQVQADVVGRTPAGLDAFLADLTDAHTLAAQGASEADLRRLLLSVGEAPLFAALPAVTADAVTALLGPDRLSSESTVAFTGFAAVDPDLYEFDTAAGYRVYLHDARCLAVTLTPSGSRPTQLELRFAVDNLRGPEVEPLSSAVVTLTFGDARILAWDGDPSMPNEPGGQVSSVEQHRPGWFHVCLLNDAIDFRARSCAVSVAPADPT